MATTIEPQSMLADLKNQEGDEGFIPVVSFWCLSQVVGIRSPYSFIQSLQTDVILVVSFSSENIWKVWPSLQNKCFERLDCLVLSKLWVPLAESQLHEEVLLVEIPT